MKQMKSLQQEQLVSDQTFRSSKCGAATASMCTTPSMSTASGGSGVCTCALAVSCPSYVNNLTVFNSGTAWPHIAGVICGQHRAACPSLLRGHPPCRDVLGKQQLAHAHLALTV
ncbi:uncharacterized protein LOC119318676 [Triticum dicoccoides]|uniref:uncharacterized protein LOC119318676 n=1 Tax=Triticum dicoccoides TaxID=85692 RepID=UPI000E78BF85|nr:uncharacterized protein LOC119318676 [Triticum dicoccoides]